MSDTIRAQRKRGSALSIRRERLKLDEEQYLRDCGWKYICDTPGSLWLWQRQYKGKTILVNMDIALHMQAHFNSGVYTPD